MGLLDWLLPAKAPLSQDPDLEAGVERLIQTLDPRLKALSAAQRTLQPAVATALAFCRHTVAQLPGPLDASPSHWRESPQLRALFARADEVQQVFSRQALVQEHVAQHPGTPMLHAVLGAVLEEKKGFGVALNGDAVQHDVAVTTLNFSRHRLFLPRATATELEDDLVWALFDQLALELLARLTTMRESQADLQEEIARLRTQLAHLQHQGLGDAFCQSRSDAPAEPCTDQAERLAERLKSNQAALHQARESIRNLDDTLTWVASSLAQPDTLVTVERRDYRVDSVNQLLTPNQPGQDLHFTHLRFENPQPRQGVILKVSYPVSELLPRSAMTREIERFFG